MIRLEINSGKLAEMANLGVPKLTHVCVSEKCCTESQHIVFLHNESVCKNELEHRSIYNETIKNFDLTESQYFGQIFKRDIPLISKQL